MSSSDKTKLDGIQAGAEVNVNADWSSVSGDSQILNKNGETLLDTVTNQYLKFPAISDPGASAADTLRLYAKKIAGRLVPKWVGPFGLDNQIQALIACNKIAWVS